MVGVTSELLLLDCSLTPLGTCCGGESGRRSEALRCLLAAREDSVVVRLPAENRPASVNLLQQHNVCHLTVHQNKQKYASRDAFPVQQSQGTRSGTRYEISMSTTPTGSQRSLETYHLMVEHHGRQPYRL